MAENQKTESREGKEREVTISFGTLAKIKPEIAPNRVDVIYDVGSEEDDNFFSARLHDPDDWNERWFWLGGTTSPDQIEEIIDQLSEEEVFAAAERGMKKNVPSNVFPELRREGLEVLRKNLVEAAQKGPRKIKLG